mgnify:FL=1
MNEPPADAAPVERRPSSPGPAGPTGRPARSPVLALLRSLPRATFALAVAVAVVVAVAVLVVANPGARLGPVRPASPPVGRELPAP